MFAASWPLVAAGDRKRCEEPEGDVTNPAESLSFADSVYTEALSLAEQAQDYLREHAPRERAQLGLAGRALITSEAMRLTARLAEVIAWLMTQRAVQAGEMTREEADLPCHRLSRQVDFAQADANTEALLPPGLRDLLDESHRLYKRVARLDSMLGKAER
jgi:regulator of CtrA degradation